MANMPTLNMTPTSGHLWVVATSALQVFKAYCDKKSVDMVAVK